MPRAVSAEQLAAELPPSSHKHEVSRLHCLCSAKPVSDRGRAARRVSLQRRMRSSIDKAMNASCNPCLTYIQKYGEGWSRSRAAGMIRVSASLCPTLRPARNLPLSSPHCLCGAGPLSAQSWILYGRTITPGRDWKLVYSTYINTERM